MAISVPAVAPRDLLGHTSGHDYRGFFLPLSLDRTKITVAIFALGAPDAVVGRIGLMKQKDPPGSTPGGSFYRKRCRCEITDEDVDLGPGG